jgi:hypothetical protein
MVDGTAKVLDILDTAGNEEFSVDPNFLHCG